MSNGLITQIIGAVIDVEFEKTNVPKVYEALTIDETGTVLEVQQQLGDGVVRAIAMGVTEASKEASVFQEQMLLFLYQLEKRPLEELWMYLETQSMKEGQLARKKKCLFTESHLLIQN